MIRMSSADIGKRYQQEMKITNESILNLEVKERMESACKEFMQFAKQVIPVLKGMQKTIAGYMNNRSLAVAQYRGFLGILNKYENLNLNQYTQADVSKVVFGDLAANAETVKANIDKFNGGIKNPYFNLFHWVRGEIFDIEAVVEAMKHREAQQSNIIKNEKKKVNTQQNLDNVVAGRKSVKTLFKNQNDAGTMATKVEITEREIEALNVLVDLMTQYLGGQVVPAFKAKKNAIYSKII